MASELAEPVGLSFGRGRFLSSNSSFLFLQSLKTQFKSTHQDSFEKTAT